MKLTATTLLAVASAATARIVGVAAPKEITPGSAFTIVLITENYIQSVLDVSAASGLSPNVFPDSLGTYLSSSPLGPSQSNVLTNITMPAQLPTWPVAGTQYHLTAAITSLYGATSSPITIIFSLPIEVANTTSSELVSSTNGVNACSTDFPNPSAPSTATSSPSPTPSQSCQDEYDACRSVTDPNNPPNFSFCASQFAKCQDTCQVLYDACRSVTDVSNPPNFVFCASQYAGCLGHNPFTSSGSATVFVTSSASVTSGDSLVSPTSGTGLSELDDTRIAVQHGLTVLIDEVIRQNFTAAQSQYNSLSISFDRIRYLVDQNASCPSPPPGRQLTQVEAIQLIQTIQGLLNRISLEVANGETAAALADACAVSADYFNSGLREFVF